MQELSVLQDKHSNRPGVFDDAVEEEQEIEILTQEISQVRRKLTPLNATDTT